MDNRTALNSGSLLCFPGMECEIEQTVGKGSNAIVYLGRYEDALSRGLFHRVIIKELFPYHPDNLIYRTAEGAVEYSEKAQEYFALQKKSFEYGNEIHLRMLGRYPDKVGANINTFCLKGTLYSVLGFDSGESLDKKYDGEKKSLSEVVCLMLDILDAVEIFHKTGYLHLDISPDNILVTGEGRGQRVTLIDYNSIHSIDEIRSGSAVYCSAKEGYTAPEVLSSDIDEICEGSDIYSVTAVFYRLLTGKRLSLYQSLCKGAPDIRGSELIKGVPDTVLSQISLILRRGLCSLSRKRYKDCESMRQDLNELLLRTQGTGITHAALWETGRHTVSKMVRANPSLQYLKNEGSLYPIRVSNDSGESMLISDALEKQIQKGSALIYGGAGMGKTTALLHSVITKSRRYSPVNPAIIYVSLFGYSNSEDNFIKNRILENLKFDKSISTMEDARNRLIKEFSTAVKTKQGERAKYLLMLDGFNEADGDTQGLINEILSLSKLKGVCLIVSMRNKDGVFPFDSWKLSSLQQGDILRSLEENHLAYPDSEKMRELLKTPLMLSMFCKAAADNEKQLSCQSAEELMSAYIRGICEKEIATMGEDSAERWLVDAAVNLVLPCVSAKIAEKNSAVTGEELLKTVKKCYRLISYNHIYKLFPEYIGHSKDIKCKAKNAEQWYGDVIIKVLWRKTGLLIKEPDGGYRLMHQLLSEYLMLCYKNISGRIRKSNIFSFSLAFSSVLIASVALMAAFRPNPYDITLAKSYLDSVVISQVNSGGEISSMMKLIEQSDIQEFDFILSQLEDKLNFHRNLIENQAIGSSGMTQKIYDELKKTGKVMPWSKENVNEDDTKALFSLSEDISQSYTLYSEILRYLMNNEQAQKAYGEQFRHCLKEKIAADAALSDALFYSACTVHLSPMESTDPDSYSHYWLTIGENADLSDEDSGKPDMAETQKLKKIRQQKTDELNGLEIFTIYRRDNQ